MVYKDLTFPQLKNRPYFITDFVSTVDGKVKVLRPKYWPIGSKKDNETFTFLRAHADAIVDGKNTALEFGKNTIETINSSSFKKLRKQLGKSEYPKYIVLAKHNDNKLEQVLENPYGFKTEIFSGTIGELVQKLHKANVQIAFIDGGPRLLGSFLEKNLLDEIFITIAPRIFGSLPNQTITMVEGILFPPEKIKLKLLSVNNFNNEVYVRYKVIGNWGRSSDSLI